MNFNPELETNKIIKFIREYYKKSGVDGAILGISGGKDSAVVAAIMVEALGKENIIGLTLPCHSVSEDKSDAQLISNYYGFSLYNFDLTNIFDEFKTELSKIGNFDLQETKDSDINLKPRLRMATVYYFAALFSKLNKKTYLTVGTSNKSEIYVGYFTKGGDSVHDIAPIADLTVDEVIKIGEYLKVPEKVLYKIPNDGLSKQSDEQKLGVSYADIAKYMNDKNSVSKKIKEKIKKLHDSNMHKFNIPTYKRNDTSENI